MSLFPPCGRRETQRAHTHKLLQLAPYLAMTSWTKPFLPRVWPDDLSDEEILERLLALNLDRAGKWFTQM